MCIIWSARLPEPWQKRDDVFALLKAGFPGGSITGTPKIRAMEIINELESVMRSVYCGAFSWIDFSGNMDSNICIRTLVKEDEKIHCWGGGGVVADSVGEQEYQESLDKINLFMDALMTQISEPCRHSRLYMEHINTRRDSVCPSPN